MFGGSARKWMLIFNESLTCFNYYWLIFICVFIDGQSFCVRRCNKAYKIPTRECERVWRTKERKTMKSMVLVKKSQLVLDENHQLSSSSSEGNRDCSSLNLPEMEFKVSGKDVLIKILCEKQKSNLIKIMAEIEKLGLSITNSSVLPFGPTFDISIIAQVTIYILIHNYI